MPHLIPTRKVIAVVQSTRSEMPDCGLDAQTQDCEDIEVELARKCKVIVV